MSWILIFSLYAGTLSKSDSVALNTAVFQTQEACENAGKEFKNQFSTIMKGAKYICVPSK